MNFRYPIFLDLSSKKCLVTGEGYEIAFKVQALVDAGAKVTYVNPRAEPPVEALAIAGLLHWKSRDFQPSDLEGCFLVIADTHNNAPIFRLAEQQRILCNSVDDPENCRFTFAALHRQGDLTIAISTNGWAPAVAVRIKEWLQREIGPEYAIFLQILKEVRPQITAQIPDFGTRRDLWYRIVDSDVLSKIRAGDQASAEQTVRQMVADCTNSISRSDTSAGSGHQ